MNLTLNDNYGLFITAKNGLKSILKNIVVILKMKLTEFQKKFLTHELKWGVIEIEGTIKERKRQYKEKEIDWGESTFTYIIDKKKEEIQDLKNLAKYFNLDINKY